MAKNTKTPVMVLQELAVKRNTVPEYELIFSQQGTHENIFHYSVKLLGAHATGAGRSKKEAKQQAASKALDQLAEDGIHHPDEEPSDNAKQNVYQDHLQTKAPLNYIPKLHDICLENKIPPPLFVQISEVGPPHCREFTYECRIASITTRVTAGSKKHAKQIAAKDMLDKIMNIIPELQVETGHLMLCDDDEEVIRRYNTFSSFALGKVNFNSKAIEYDLQLKQLMEDLRVTKESVMTILEKPPSREVLEGFVRLLGLEYELKTLQETPPIVMVDVNSETPITVMQTAETIAEAEVKVVEQTLRMLKAFVA